MWVCSHIQSQPLWLLRTTLSHWTALPVCMIPSLFQKHFTGKCALVGRRWTYHQMATEPWSLTRTSMLQPVLVSWEWQRSSLVPTSTSVLLCCSSLEWKMISQESVQQMWLSEVGLWILYLAWYIDFSELLTKQLLKYNSFFYTAAQAPAQPTNVRVANVSSSSAIIQWTVPLISYTPEQYMVQFGLRQNMLNETSTTVDGNRNISVVNVTHALVLDVLLPGTTYYFRVIARNGFGSAQSSLGTLTTLLMQQGTKLLPNILELAWNFIFTTFHVTVLQLLALSFFSFCSVK